MKKLVAVSLLLSSTIPAIALADDSFADPSKPIIVSAEAPEFQIQLKANPGSTGYRWFYLADNSSPLVTVESEKYIPSNTKLIGAPGTDIWTFKVDSKAFNAPTAMTVTLAYAQSWNVSSAKKLVLQVVTD